MHLSRLTVAVLLALGWTSAAWAQPKAPPVSEATKTTVRANNDFACDLYRQMAQAKPGENAFFSPWSISSALAMTMEGARNDTAAEMGQTLRLPKDLRQTGDRPWRLGMYHEGFTDLLRRCTPPRDLVKEAAIRKELAGLRKQLDDVNRKLAKLYSPKLNAEATKLAATVNRLQQQIDLYELNVANSIWGEKTYPFEGEYLQTVGRFYGTGLVRDADFINNFPTERTKINRWVEEQTKDRIKDLIPPIEPQLARLIRMILVNAIYFKGQWQEPFKKELTKPEVFHLGNGAKDKTPLMRQHMPARYAAFNADGSFFDSPRKIGFDRKVKTYPEAGGFLVAELPYKGDRLAMTILLPRTPNGLAALEKQLTGDMLTRTLGQLQKWNVQVTLPKFKMETTYELGKGLQELGMKKAFMERVADFGGMSKSSEKLYISRVIHKAFVDVNEEGTEAAAATAVLMATPTSAPATFPFIPDFRADRPFVFLIREIDTGAILFMGRMTMPTK